MGLSDATLLGMRALLALGALFALLISIPCGYAVPAAFHLALTLESPSWLATVSMGITICWLSCCATLVVVDLRRRPVRCVLLVFDAGLSLGSLWFAWVILPPMWNCWHL